MTDRIKIDIYIVSFMKERQIGTLIINEDQVETLDKNMPLRWDNLDKSETKRVYDTGSYNIGRIIGAINGAMQIGVVEWIPTQRSEAC